uniref:Uncharacterized protein n=1 Tax=Romanomermis culicivorax TaxID=13658 RepID=A0A915J8S7_ROMCU
MWITEQPVENMIEAKLDSIVISSPSFPTNYWDKFVKKKVKDKYKEQFDEAELDRRLGLDKTGTPSDGMFSSLTTVDGRYFLWKMCVIISDRSFLYQLAYFGLSILGNWNPFFYAGHLIDMVISFPMLQTILKSVTHNGRQNKWNIECYSLSATVLLLLKTTNKAVSLAKSFKQQPQELICQSKKAATSSVNCLGLLGSFENMMLLIQVSPCSITLGMMRL